MASINSLFLNIGVIIEVLVCDVLLKISFLFAKKYRQSRQKDNLFFVFVFLSFFFFTVLEIIYQFFVKYTCPLFGLIFIQRLIIITLLFGSYFLFLLLNKRSRIHGDKGVVVLFTLLFFGLIITAAVSPIYLLQVKGSLQPQVIISYLALPFFNFDIMHLIWFIMWLLFGLASLGAVFFTKKDAVGQKILYLYAFVSSLFFVFAYALMSIYTGYGQAFAFPLSWIFILLGSLGMVLGEGIDPSSQLALNPLNFFRSRLLFRLIYVLVFFIIVIFCINYFLTVGQAKMLINPDIPQSTLRFELMETNSLLYLVIGIILTILSGVIFADMLERPLRKLIKGTKAVAAGDLSYKVTSGSIDELGELAQAYNHMTEDLRNSQNRLILSEKMISLGNMAAGMAHEIRNPLVSLRTFTQLLVQKWDDHDFRKKFSTIVPREIERINRIAESLLKFGRPWQADVKDVNINSVLEEVLLLFEPEMKTKNITLSTKFADMPIFRGDAPQLVQAFTNVVKNAIEAMTEKGGGTLFIETEYILALKLRDRTYSIHEMTWGNRIEEKPYIVVKITDTGGGVPEGKLRNLFDPFFTSKTYGTGMGLPITLRILEEHYATIKVKTKPGEGTTFVIYIPQESSPRK